MNYFLFKLQFETAVHFGGSESALSLYTSEQTLRADTLFSALCHEALVQGGQEALQHLCEMVQQGKLLLSDMMPWCGKQFFLPKPLMPSSSTEEVDTKLRKKVKKLAWIPVTEFDRYAKSLHEGHFDPQNVPESFGVQYEQTKAAVPSEEDATPYQVGLFRFAPDCGLYFICGCAEDEQVAQMEDLLDGLGMSGIGGRVSTGCGKFCVAGKIELDHAADTQTRWMARALSTKSTQNLLLTTSLPQEQELDAALDGAAFQLVRRSGFMASERVQSPIKKRTQYFLAAGSVLKNTYQGALYDVGLTEAHPVYRYAKPIFMGVTL